MNLKKKRRSKSFLEQKLWLFLCFYDDVTLGHFLKIVEFSLYYPYKCEKKIIKHASYFAYFYPKLCIPTIEQRRLDTNVWHQNFNDVIIPLIWAKWSKIQIHSSTYGIWTAKFGKSMSSQPWAGENAQKFYENLIK